MVKQGGERSYTQREMTSKFIGEVFNKLAIEACFKPGSGGVNNMRRGTMSAVQKGAERLGFDPSMHAKRIVNHRSKGHNCRESVYEDCSATTDMGAFLMNRTPEAIEGLDSLSMTRAPELAKFRRPTDVPAKDPLWKIVEKDEMLQKYDQAVEHLDALYKSKPTEETYLKMLKIQKEAKSLRTHLSEKVLWQKQMDVYDKNLESLQTIPLEEWKMRLEVNTYEGVTLEHMLLRYGSGEEVAFTAECIEGTRKGRGGSSEYLIKWRGYKQSLNSWEPASNIDVGLIEEFEGVPGLNAASDTGGVTSAAVGNEEQGASASAQEAEEELSSARKAEQKQEEQMAMLFIQLTEHGGFSKPIALAQVASEFGVASVHTLRKKVSRAMSRCKVTVHFRTLDFEVFLPLKATVLELQQAVSVRLQHPMLKLRLCVDGQRLRLDDTLQSALGHTRAVDVFEETSGGAPLDDRAVPVCPVVLAMKARIELAWKTLCEDDSDDESVLEAGGTQPEAGGTQPDDPLNVVDGNGNKSPLGSGSQQDPVLLESDDEQPPNAPMLHDVKMPEAKIERKQPPSTGLGEDMEEVAIVVLVQNGPSASRDSQPSLSSAKVLVATQPPGSACEGQLAFPGGKLKMGDGPGGAGAREIFEETGVTVNALVPIGSWYTSQRQNHLFLCSDFSGVPFAKEQQSILEWIPLEKCAFFERVYQIVSTGSASKAIPSLSICHEKVVHFLQGHTRSIAAGSKRRVIDVCGEPDNTGRKRSKEPAVSSSGMSQMQQQQQQQQQVVTTVPGDSTKRCANVGQQAVLNDLFTGYSVKTTGKAGTGKNFIEESWAEHIFDKERESASLLWIAPHNSHKDDLIERALRRPNVWQVIQRGKFIKTAASAFSIPMEGSLDPEMMIAGMSADVKELVRRPNFKLIINEADILSPYKRDAIGLVLAKLRNNSLPDGGAQVLEQVTDEMELTEPACVMIAEVFNALNDVLCGTG